MKLFRYFLFILFSIIYLGSLAQCTVNITSKGGLCNGQSNILTATATGVAPIKYQWQKDGSNITPETKLTYTTTVTGNYNVVITDKNGCTSTSNNIIINPLPPVPGFTVPPIACGNSPCKFSSVTPNGMASYVWDFGDGTNSKIQNPSHAFTTALGNSTQTFNVKLIVTDNNGCSNSVTQTVTVNQVPDTLITDITPNIRSQFVHCFNGSPGVTDCNLIIQNNSKTINSNYKIDWGDGTTPYNSPTLPATYQHPYAAMGAYTIVMTIQNSLGCKSVKTDNYFCGSNPAGALVSPGNTIGCAPQKFIFTISGTDNNAPGTNYYVTYSDSVGILHFVQPPRPTITHTFRKASCGYNPAMGEKNSFIANLDITNPCGNTSSPVLSIHIEDKPVTSYTYTSPVCINNTITFTNKTTDCILKANGNQVANSNFRWSISPSSGWNMINSPTSTNLNVKFTQSGSYSVKLYSSNFCGADSITQVVNVSEPPIADAVPDFITNSGNSCNIPFQVNFTNTSSGQNVNYTWSVTTVPANYGGWNFVTPTNASSASPKLNFSKIGTFTVTLKASNSCGSPAKNFTITIYGKPSVSLKPFNACVSQPVDMTNFVIFNNIPSIKSYQWSISPSTGWNIVTPTSASSGYPKINFSQGGTYQVKVKIISSTCPADSSTQNIIINPIPTVTIPLKDSTLCPGNSIFFSANATGNNLSYQWKNNITNINGATTSTYNTNAVGTYTCIVSSGLGCSQTSNKIIVSISQLTVGVTANSTSIPNGTSTILHGSITKGSGTYTYYWKSGNDLANPLDSTKNLNPPTDNLDKNTTYTLYVTDNKTKCKVSAGILIKISGNILNVNVNAIPSVICIGNSTHLYATAGGGSGSYTYLWTSKPKDITLKTSALPNVTVSPVVTTSYLMTVNDGFNKVMDSVTVVVDPKPKVSFIYDLPCSDRLTYFQYTGSPPQNITAYWNFGDSDFSDSVKTHHYYENNGLFKVTLTIRDTNGCKDSTFKQINVNPGLKMDFLSDTVCFGDNTYLKSLLLTSGHNIVTYEWKNLNDYTIIGTASDVSYKFSSDGLFLIQLKSTDDNGCSDSIVHYINVLKNPQAEYSYTIVDAGNTTVFSDGSMNGSGTINSWLWDFGISPPNNTSIIPDPQHLYALPGNYDVSLKVTDKNGCIDSIRHNVIVRNINIHSSFLINTNPACEGNTVSFTDNSDSDNATITGWKWCFGDIASGIQDSSYLQNPTHYYSKAGTYIVTLKINCNGITDISTKTLIVYTNPKAGFLAYDACQGSPVPLTDMSSITSGNIFKWEWFVDNVKTYYLQGPFVYTFNNSGLHNISLKITSGFGCSDSLSKTINIYPELGIDFISDTVCFGGITNLTHKILTPGHNIVKYEWKDLYDNLVLGTGADISYNFPTDGLYLVQLKAIDNNGCSDSVSHYVKIFRNPEAGFAANAVVAGSATIFKDESMNGSGKINKWLWSFGISPPNNISIIQNPQITYPSAGNYNVNLKVTDIYGCTDNIDHQVTVISIPLHSAFKAMPSPACESDTIHFKDYSTIGNGTITGWKWKFGDPPSGKLDSSILQNPYHYYSIPGNYVVSLTVYSNSSSDFSTQTITVNANPKPDFTFNTVCFGDTTYFKSFIPGNLSPVSYLWLLGDGETDVDSDIKHLYEGSAMYNVKLITTYDNGCFNFVNHPVIVYSLPKAFYKVSNSNALKVSSPVSFIDKSFATSPGANLVVWSWNFGDGSSLDNASNPVHIFNYPGKYIVVLTMTDDHNCADSYIDSILVNSNVIAKFTFDTVCFGNPSHFYDHSSIGGNNAIIKWHWDFGDGSASEYFKYEDKILHIYNADSTYKVLLKVTGNNGISDTSSNYIIVRQKPKADFTAKNTCAGKSAEIADATLYKGNLKEWIWDFGNDQKSSMKGPHSVKYDSSKTYNVSLIVTSENDCSDTVVRSIKVNPLPLVRFTADTMQGCENPALTVVFNGDSSRIAEGYIDKWSWHFGDNAESNSAHFAVHTYDKAGVYNVSLNLTSDKGCDSIHLIDDMIIIHPKPASGFVAIPPRTSIISPVIKFDDTSVNAVRWHWNFGDGVCDTIFESPDHAYTKPGIFTVTQYVYSSYGCLDSAIAEVIINNDVSIFIPNAFAPGKLGINSNFLPKGIGINESDFKMWIFNRWGEEIYSTNDFFKGWDGTIDKTENIVPEGTYIYKILLKDIDGNSYTKFGKVTVLRK